MNQSELILKTAQITGMKRNEVEHALKVAFVVVTAALVEEGEATVPGLGKLIAMWWLMTANKQVLKRLKRSKQAWYFRAYPFQSLRVP